MKWYKADLHIHSVLSPCGDLEMSPSHVIPVLLEKGIDIFAITDHNRMKNFPAFQKVAFRNGITCIPGIEVQTQEEVHLLALFDDHAQAEAFEEELYSTLLPIDNDPDYFGDQVIIDENENILDVESRALINSSMWTLDEAVEKVREYGGLCYPAHEDAMTNSITAQLGFIPENLNFIAVGITAKCNLENLFTKFPYFKKYALVRSSDAHYVKDIGSGITEFFLEKPTIAEIELALQGIDGRKYSV